MKEHLMIIISAINYTKYVIVLLAGWCIVQCSHHVDTGSGRGKPALSCCSADYVDKLLKKIESLFADCSQ